LYVSLTKKFIGLSEEKGAARGLKKAGLKDALQLYCHRYKNAHTDHVSNRDARTGNQGMFKGDRHILCKNQGQWPTFPSFEFNPNEPGVDKVEAEGPNGDEILSSVHLASVATQEDGIAIATKVNTAALNRISFFHGIAIENSQRTDAAQFSPLNPQPGEMCPGTGNYTITGYPA